MKRGADSKGEDPKMERFCSFTVKASLTLLLVNLFMLLFVERGSAEEVVTILSVAMMAVLFAASSRILRKRYRKEEMDMKNKKRRRS